MSNQRLLRGSGESGQTLVVTVLLIIALVGCIIYVSDLGQMTEEKIKLQAAADAGSTAGAAFIADTLNYLAIGNWLILAATGASVVSGGKTSIAVSAIESTQAAIIKAGAAPAHAMAYKVAKQEGASNALPWNRGVDGKFIKPELMVAQEKRIWDIFTAVSQTSGRVVVDKLEETCGRDYGERYVLLGVTLKASEPLDLGSRIPVLNKTRSRLMAISQSATIGGRIWFNKLAPPYPGYRSHLTKVTNKHKGRIVKH